MREPKAAMVESWEKAPRYASEIFVSGRTPQLAKTFSDPSHCVATDGR